MAINANQLIDLVKMLRQTHEVELSCPECLEELDKYAQNILDRTPIEGILYLVREHLEACPFCKGEFNLVLETIKAIEEA